MQTIAVIAPREVLVAVVHRLELAAVDRHARRLEQAQHTAERNKPCTDLSQRRSTGVVLAVAVAHTATLVAAGGLLAWAVFQFLGLKVLTHSWFNLSRI